MNFIDNLIDETDRKLKEICIACRSYIPCIINYDDGRTEIAKIIGSEKRPGIIDNMLKFEND